MKQKVCVITGANSGIGKAASIDIAKQGYKVIMVCRNKQRGEKARKEIMEESGNKNVELLLADLSSQKQIKDAAQKINKKYKRLDVLINNAGVVNLERKLTKEGYEYTFAVNHLAYFYLTHLLLDKLKKSQPSRIINVASNAHNFGKMHFDDLSLKDYGAMKAYGQSKLANLLFTFELSDRLKDTKVTCNCLHPGVVATNIWQNKKGIAGKIARFLTPVFNLFMRSPQKGAETVVYLATSDEIKNTTGKYFVDKKPVKPANHAISKKDAKKLWILSKKMTGL